MELSLLAGFVMPLVRLPVLCCLVLVFRCDCLFAHHFLCL